MPKNGETSDYEIGYGKPPKSGQFKKGQSGNLSGRPKKPSDGDAEWRRELTSKMIILEKGKRKAITKSVGYKRQLLNKALSGDIRAARQVAEQEQRLREKYAEQERKAPKVPRNPNATAREYTEEELQWIVENSPVYQSMKKHRRLNGGELPKGSTDGITGDDPPETER